MFKIAITSVIVILFAHARLVGQDLDQQISFSKEQVKKGLRKKFMLWLACDGMEIDAYVYSTGKYKKNNVIATPVRQTGYRNQLNTFYQLTSTSSEQYLIDFPSGTRVKVYSSSEIIFGYVRRKWKNIEVVGEAYIQQGQDDNHIEVTAGKTKIFSTYANLRISNYKDDPYCRIAIEKGMALIKHDTSFIRLERPGTELWINKSTGDMWIEDIPVHGLRDKYWETEFARTIKENGSYISQQICNWQKNLMDNSEAEPSLNNDTLFRKLSFEIKTAILSFIMQNNVSLDHKYQISASKNILISIDDYKAEKVALVQKAVIDFILFDKVNLFDSLLMSYRDPFTKKAISHTILSLKNYHNADQYKNFNENLPVINKAWLFEGLLPWPCKINVDTADKEVTYDIWIPKKMFIARKLKEYANKYSFVTYIWMLRQNVDRGSWLTCVNFHSKRKKLTFWHTSASCCIIDYDKSLQDAIFIF